MPRRADRHHRRTATLQCAHDHDRLQRRRRGTAAAAGRRRAACQGVVARRYGRLGRAHTLAQDVESADGAWVHAYLHRREGDISNAHYWYRRAGRPPASGALDDERRAIVAALLGE